MNLALTVAGLFGLVCLLAWLLAVGWVVRRSPKRAVRAGLVRVLPALRDTLNAIGRDPAIADASRKAARRAERYLRWPIDLLPSVLGTVGHIDDLVFALGAFEKVRASDGIEALERSWCGDEVGWNALRSGLELAPEWNSE